MAHGHLDPETLGEVVDHREALERELPAVTDSRRATTFQHVGKGLADEGLWGDAAEQFMEALNIRVAIGAASDLIDSSRSALERARS